MNKKLFILLLLGLFFRIAISFYTYSGDVTNHMIWGEIAVRQGLQGLYDIDFYKLYGHISPNYPPITILFFAFLYLVKIWVYQFAWFLNLHLPIFPSKLIFFLKDFNYYPYLLKLPAISSDIGIAYLTYLFMKRIVGRKKSNWPIISAAWVLFNPAYFYNSAYWGQTDSIPLFFIMSSFYALLYSKKFLLSGVLFTLGLLSKQIIVIFIPLFFILLFHLSRMKIFFKTITVSLIVFWLFFLPFYQSGNLILFPLTTYLNKIILVSGLPFTSNHAFNFWYLLTGSRTTLASSKFILNISYEIWGYFITGIITLITLYVLMSSLRKPRLTWRKQGSRKILDSRLHGNNNIQNIFYIGFLIPFTSFIFLTKMHERHLILTLPFLLIATYNNKFLLISYLFISLFNFLNAYHNWWSPPLPFLQRLLSSSFVINSLTLLLIGFFFILFINYFKENFLREKSK